LYAKVKYENDLKKNLTSLSLLTTWIHDWQNDNIYKDVKNSLFDRIIYEFNNKFNSFDNFYWRLPNATLKKPLISTGNKTERQMDFRNKTEELAITRSECVFFKNNSLSYDFDRVVAVVHSTLYSKITIYTA
jgi:hypothetical protein